VVLLIYLNVAPQFVDRDVSGNPRPPAPSGHPGRSTSAMGGSRFDLKTRHTKIGSEGTNQGPEVISTSQLWHGCAMRIPMP